MTTEQIGTTTQSFSEGKRLSEDLRATSPEEVAAMVAELERVSKTAKDVVMGAPMIGIDVDLADGIHATVPHFGDALTPLGIGRIAHEQFGEKLGIPRSYYGRMLADAPGLLANNLNYWLAHTEKNYLIRTLDGRIRALLSDRFRTLDNQGLFFHAFAEGKDMEATVQRMELSDERFYMRLVLPSYAAKITGRGADLTATKGSGLVFSSGYKNDNGRWQGPDDDDPDGDWIFPTVVVSNSEVGRGGLNVEAGALRVTCNNLILVGVTLHKIHLGERQEDGFQITDETREVKDKGIWLEVRDLIRATFDEEKFRAMVDHANNAQDQILEEPVEAVDTVVKHFGMNDADKQAILNELIAPSFAVKPGATVWGLLNAVTALADRRGIEEGAALARAGGAILNDDERELVPIKVRPRQ